MTQLGPHKIGPGLGWFKKEFEMKLLCKQVVKGPGPGEVIVDLPTSSGTEDVIVDDSFVTDMYLHVWEICSQGDKILVELPRETSAGNWKIWVSRDSVAA